MLPEAPRRMLLAAFAAVLFLEVAWACVTPAFRGPDEVFHVYRASSVSLGQWRPDYAAADRGELVATKVEPDIVASAEHVCRELYAEHRDGTCDPIRTFDDGNVGMASSADRYNPVYYAIVGYPARPFEGTAAIWAMRAASALLCAVLVGWGLFLLMAGARTAWPGLAFMAAATPAVFFAGATVAPNSVSFASAMLLWAALITVTRESVVSRVPVVAATVGAGLLVSTHTTGPLWLGTIVVSHLVYAGWRRYVAVIRSDLRSWLVAIVVVGLISVASIAWTLSASTNNPSAGGEPLVDEVKEIPVAAHVLLWFFQTIGVMPYRFGILWLVVYALWLPAIGALLVRALRRGTTRSRLGLLTALALSVAIPAAATVMTYDELGVAWQGRYGLPLLFGVLLLGAEGLDQPDRHPPRWVVVGAAVLFGATQSLALLCLGLRERSGDFDDGRPWPVLLLVAPCVVAVSYVLLTRLSARRKAPDRVIGSFA